MLSLGAEKTFCFVEPHLPGKYYAQDSVIQGLSWAL